MIIFNKMEEEQMHLLCTGGLGYIGSHTVLELLKNNYKVTIIDNLCNSSRLVLDILEDISKKKINFVLMDIRDEDNLRQLFKKYSFDAVIHFAGLKAVGESVRNPLDYYNNNVHGTITLLKVMKETNCKVIVFSSSATVYKSKETPLIEEDILSPSNPYGQTKFMIEQILKDIYNADNSWKITILRYFNPIGCHPSCMIGEYVAEPTNLLPYIQQVSIGLKPHLNIFGNDWPTIDGTGVRDYLHVVDLADGHIAAFEMLMNNNKGRYDIYNLGTGKGTSVLQIKKCFEESSGLLIPYKFTDRRPGDLSSVIADPSKAEKELNWKAKRTIMDACKGAWIWQSTHPNGYKNLDD